jgi:hypothetical protein
VSVPFLISYDWLQVFVVWFWFDFMLCLLYWSCDFADEKIEACGFYIIYYYFFFFMFALIFFVVWLIWEIINLAFVYGEVVYDYMIHDLLYI